MVHKSQIKATLLHFVIVLALLLSATGIGHLLRGLGLPGVNIVIAFFLAALLTSLLISSYAFAALVSMLAAFLFNLLFTEPYPSLAINALSYMATLFIMNIAVLSTSTMAFHARQGKHSAREREFESRALYASTNLLMDAKTFPETAELAADTINRSVRAGVVCLCFDESNKPEDFYIQCLPG